MFSVSTVLGEKASDVEQSCRESAKLSGRRPPPLWTGRGQLKEGILFGELSYFFIFSSFFLRSVRGWMGMDV